AGHFLLLADLQRCPSEALPLQRLLFRPQALDLGSKLILAHRPPRCRRSNPSGSLRKYHRRPSTRQARVSPPRLVVSCSTRLAGGSGPLDGPAHGGPMQATDRRTFLAVVCLGFTGVPVSVPAQPVAKVYRIGYLSAASEPAQRASREAR